MLDTEFLICPARAVEQSHREMELLVDGISDIPEGSVRCNPSCPGPIIELHTSTLRKIGSRILPGVVSANRQIARCGNS